MQVTTRDMAEEAARLLAQSLPAVVAKGTDLKARTAALIGAHLAGRALDEASMGLHHRICHVLGGTFKLPHARTHAVVLPHVVAFNAPAAPEAMQRLAPALGNNDVAAGLDRAQPRNRHHLHADRSRFQEARHRSRRR